MLKELVPRISRVAVLRNPTNPGHARSLEEAKGTARSLGLSLQVLEARAPDEIDGAFAAMTGERAGALLVLWDGMFLGTAKALGLVIPQPLLVRADEVIR